MIELTNKIVWITGASSGIGEALAYEFAQKGAKLVLSARRTSELERVAKATGLSEENILVLQMDMLEFDKFPAMVQNVLTRFGQIDFIIQNAGISQRSYVKDTKFQVYRDLMELDFFSIVSFTQALLPYLTQQKSGHFVVISSIAGKIGVPLRGGYGAAKHAIIAFFDSLRAEIWQDNINVTTICPGYIKTQISVNALDSSGNKYGKMDDNQANGMTAEVFAKKAVRAIINNRKEVYIGGFYEVFGVYLKRFLPSLVYKMVRKK